MLNPFTRLSSAWNSNRGVAGGTKRRKRSNSYRLRRKLLLEGLEDRRLMAFVGRVIEDGVPLGGVNNGSLGSFPSEIVDVGGVGYFVASDGVNGTELWRVNPSGPSNFATMVENAIPGGGIGEGASSSTPSNLTNVGGTLYFVAEDGVNGRELWRINGSGAAEMVEDSVPGNGISLMGGSDPSDLTAVGSTLYFVASDDDAGRELWRVTGSTPAEMVEDSLVPDGGIRPGILGSSPAYLTNVAGQLFFKANDGTNGGELWRVPAGGGNASMVEDSIPGQGIAPNAYDPYLQSLTNLNGTLFFSASNSVHGQEIWQVVGSGNAVMIDDTLGGTDGIGPNAYGVYASDFTLSGGTVYFRASTVAAGDELWRITSNGTAQLVEDAIPGGGINPGADPAYPSSLVDVAGTLHFLATNAANGRELWRVNNSGVAEIVSRSGATGINDGAADSTPQYLTNVAGTLFFSANDGINGTELWQVSGGNAVLVEDSIAGGGLAPDSANSNPKYLTNVAGTLVFSATNSTVGRELWRIDGAGVAQLVEDIVNGSDGGIRPGPADADPRFVTPIGASVYFVAEDGFNGSELWKFTPGGAASLVSSGPSVLGINQSSASSTPENFANVGGTTYFSAFDGINGRELWRLNNAGIAELVEDAIPGGGLNPFSASSSPRDLTDVSGTLYFTADTANGTGLWRIDSTGTAVLISEKLSDGGIDLGANTPRSGGLTNVNGTLYFVAADSTSGNEVWQVLPGAGSAVLIETAPGSGGVAPAAAGAQPTSLINAGGVLYFVAQNTTVGRELWTVNGSSNAVLVEDVVPGGGIYPGSDSSSPAELFSHLGTLYFRAADGANGTELWVANGASASLVEDAIASGGIGASSSSSYPTGLVSVGSTLYFQAGDGSNGAELWRLVGAGPAVMVEDSIAGGGINPGPASSNPRFMTNIAGSLYFTANDGTTGIELWRVDNITGIAEIVEDGVAGGGIRPGSISSGPSQLTDVAGTLYFVANDGTNGIELWRVAPGQGAVMVEASVAGGGLNPAGNSSYPSQLTNTNGSLYFAAENGSAGIELWTVGGGGIAEMITGPSGGGQILPGSLGSYPLELVNIAGTLYFSADSGPTRGVEPMRVAPNAAPLVARINASVNGAVGTVLSNTGTWSDPDNDLVTLSASIGNVVRNGNGTWSWSFTPSAAVNNQVVTITATDPFGESAIASFNITVTAATASVLNRQIFYNRSTSTVFGDGSGNPIGSIDPTKLALLPGVTATFNNVTNYSRGINGIVVDIAGWGTWLSAI